MGRMIACETCLHDFAGGRLALDNVAVSAAAAGAAGEPATEACGGGTRAVEGAHQVERLELERDKAERHADEPCAHHQPDVI